MSQYDYPEICYQEPDELIYCPDIYELVTSHPDFREIVTEGQGADLTKAEVLRCCQGRLCNNVKRRAPQYCVDGCLARGWNR